MAPTVVNCVRRLVCERQYERAAGWSGCDSTGRPGSRSCLEQGRPRQPNSVVYSTQYRGYGRGPVLRSVRSVRRCRFPAGDSSDSGTTGIAGLCGITGMAGCLGGSDWPGGEGLRVETLAVRGSPGEEVPVRPNGRVVLLDFFATWCGSCKTQLPKFRDLTERYPELHLLSITWGDDHLPSGTSGTGIKGPGPSQRIHRYGRDKPLGLS